MPTSPKSDEFFYEWGGRKQDFKLHAPILKAGDHAEAHEVTKEVLRAAGWTDEQISDFNFEHVSPEK